MSGSIFGIGLKGTSLQLAFRSSSPMTLKCHCFQPANLNLYAFTLALTLILDPLGLAGD